MGCKNDGWEYSYKKIQAKVNVNVYSAPMHSVSNAMQKTDSWARV